MKIGANSKKRYLNVSKSENNNTSSNDNHNNDQW